MVKEEGQGVREGNPVLNSKGWIEARWFETQILIKENAGHVCIYVRIQCKKQKSLQVFWTEKI